MMRLKEAAVKIVKGGMRILPSAALPSLVRRIPKLQVGVREGLKFQIDWYLGDVKVNIDTTFAIERAMISGSYDPQTVSIIHKFVRSGDVCMDVGANIGAIAFAIAKKTGPSGQVFSFEPGKLTFERFSKNLSLNPFFHGVIIPLQMGLSNKDGLLYWHEHMENRGNANLSSDLHGNGLEVPVTTIDNYCERAAMGKLDFVKIDVESMELEVIKGGMSTWERHLPILYYETLPAFEEFRGIPVFKMIEDLLRPLGYSFFKILPQGLLKATSYPDFSANTLALPPHRKQEALPG